MQNIRNFSIIAHIDHGKSTLSDRMLEVTGTVDKRKMKDSAQVLDLLELEQEKGITIKLTPVRMEWKGQILNLIDTPGHVDFGYEVSRSLAACEGAVLLVDASQGVEAQTVANLDLAKKEGLKIIPVINKIDLPSADPESVKKDLVKLFGFKEEDIILTSGKTGEGVENLLDAISEKIDPPLEYTDSLQAMIFDSIYDSYLGAVAYIRVFSGEMKRGQKVKLFQNGDEFSITEIGVFHPSRTPVESLKSGEVGYIATGYKDIRHVRVGDTIVDPKEFRLGKSEQLPGYKEPKPVVFSSFYPTDQEDYPDFKKAFEELSLNDAGLWYEETRSNTLGQGFRCGFLGVLHLEITKERLEREHEQSVVVTAPNVRLKIEKQSGEKIDVESASDFPDPSEIKKINEPIAEVTIFLSHNYLGEVIKLINNKRGAVLETLLVDERRVKLRADVPLLKLVTGFFSELKSATSGYASLDYYLKDYRESDFVKVVILVHKESVEALDFLIYRDEAESQGRVIVEKLKHLIPRHQFMIPLQAAIGGKVIARESISAVRKDVTAKLYGGDITRRQKLLKKQAKGKKRMKEFGSVSIPKDTFLKLITR